MMETLRFKNDAPARKRLFVPGAMAHPAKGHIALWQEMIERYTQPGDWILDPMSGIGTSLVAALMGRNVICVELEPHFVVPMQASWAKMQQHPMLGHTMGQAVILRGDARMLPLGSADAVLTSPPYEGSLVLEQNGIDEAKLKQSYGPNSQMNRPQAYTRPAAIVTSPPYGEALTGGGIAKEGYLLQGEGHTGAPDFIGDRTYMPRNHGEGAENIGNQRGVAYWTSMALCYAECWRVLRPGGILALVLKGFTRDGLYVDLPGQTEALLLAAGWEKHDHFRRELWSLSFWRILQKRRDPAAFDDRLNFEEVLAFRKPEGAGDGVAAVLTSPPYEQSVTGEPGIDWTKTMGGARDRTKEDAFQTVKAIHSGYTRPAAIITSPG